MNVVLVSPGFPPTDLGEQALWSQTLADELSRRARVHVFTARHDPEREPNEVDRSLHPRYEVTTVNHRRRSFWFLRDTYHDRSLAYAFDYYLSQVRPDVVHVQGLQGVTTSVIGAARRRGIPVVVTLNDFWPLCARTYRYARFGEACDQIEASRCHRCLYRYALATHKRRHWASFRRRFQVAYKHHLWGGRGIYAWRAGRAMLRALRDAWPYLPIGKRSARSPKIDRRNASMRAALAEASLFLAPSRYIAEEYLRAGIAGPTMRAVTLGASGGAKPRSRMEGAPIRFGFVDTLSPGTGAPALLEAFGRLPEGRAELHLFGHAQRSLDDVDSFEELIAVKTRAPGVHVREGFEARVLSRRLSELDVLVVPTLGRTGASYPLREALAGGLPVIATDQGGTAELVRQAGGGALLVPPGDPAALTEALSKAVRDWAGFRESVGRASGIATLDETVDEHLEIYEQLCGRRAAVTAAPDEPALLATSPR